MQDRKTEFTTYRALGAIFKKGAAAREEEEENVVICTLGVGLMVGREEGRGSVGRSWQLPPPPPLELVV